MITKTKILLVLPRGEAIRNFIWSGTSDHLRKSCEVYILSVVPNKQIEQILKSKSDGFYEIHGKDDVKVLGYVRDWLDVVHGRWLWSGAAKHRWKLRDFEASTITQKIKRWVKKNSALPFSNRTGLQVLSSVENVLSEKLFPSKPYLQLLKDIDPDLVFNGSHIHSRNSVPVMHAARKLGITTATFLFSWDNLTSQGRIMPYYDHYLVWNDQIANDLLKIYGSVRRQQVHITGTPQFDFHFQKDKLWSREEYCKKVGVDPQRPIVLYTTGMANAYPGEDVTVEGIADMLLEYPIEKRPQLVVRVYPKDNTNRFVPLRNRRPDISFPDIPWEVNWLTPLMEDLELWTNMLQHCEVGINIASTVSLELCMFNKPVINVSYNPRGMDIYPADFTMYYDWDHYKPIVDSKALYIATSEEQMAEYIKLALNDPDDRKIERENLINNFFGDTLDGKAFLRIAEVLKELAEKNKPN
ncbi:MAG: hypothetical protein M3Q97_01350 [Bacteroidota bacterium]|nr:hypothetical protein [Bacteroidota bacterium]